MMDFVRVTLSFWLATAVLLREIAVTGTPGGVQILEPLDAAQRVHGRLQHVVRVVRPERLGQDVLHPRRLEDGTDGAPRDHAGAGDGGLEEDPPGAEVACDLAGDRRFL